MSTLQQKITEDRQALNHTGDLLNLATKLAQAVAKEPDTHLRRIQFVINEFANLVAVYELHM